MCVWWGGCLCVSTSVSVRVRVHMFACACVCVCVCVCVGRLTNVCTKFEVQLLLPAA